MDVVILVQIYLHVHINSKKIYIYIYRYTQFQKVQFVKFINTFFILMQHDACLFVCMFSRFSYNQNRLSSIFMEVDYWQKLGFRLFRRGLRDIFKIFFFSTRNKFGEYNLPFLRGYWRCHQCVNKKFKSSTFIKLFTTYCRNLYNFTTYIHIFTVLISVAISAIRHVDFLTRLLVYFETPQAIHNKCSRVCSKPMMSDKNLPSVEIDEAEIDQSILDDFSCALKETSLGYCRR